MKKVLALALGMLLIPFTAFGMQTMSEADMDSITGQSGVAISISNIQVYTHAEGEEMWFVTGDSAAGIVYEAADASTYVYLDAIKDVENFAGLRGNYDPITEGDLGQLGRPDASRVLSIRVVQADDDAAVFGDMAEAGLDAAYVEIGLPTLEIIEEEGSADIFSIYVSATNTPLQDGTDSALNKIGEIHSSGGGSTTAIMGGRLGIMAYGNAEAAGVVNARE